MGALLQDGPGARFFWSSLLSGDGRYDGGCGGGGGGGGGEEELWTGEGKKKMKKNRRCKRRKRGERTVLYCKLIHAHHATEPHGRKERPQAAYGHQSKTPP